MGKTKKAAPAAAEPEPAAAEAAAPEAEPGKFQRRLYMFLIIVDCIYIINNKLCFLLMRGQVLLLLSPSACELF